MLTEGQQTSVFLSDIFNRRHVSLCPAFQCAAWQFLPQYLRPNAQSLVSTSLNMRGYQGAFSSVPQPKQRLLAFFPLVWQAAFAHSCLQSDEYSSSVSSFALLAQHPMFAKLKGRTQQRIRSQPSHTQCLVHLRPGSQRSAQKDSE